MKRSRLQDASLTELEEKNFLKHREKNMQLSRVVAHKKVFVGSSGSAQSGTAKRMNSLSRST